MFCCAVCKTRDTTKYKLAFSLNYTDAQIEQLKTLAESLPSGGVPNVQHNVIRPFTLAQRRRITENSFTMRKLLSKGNISPDAAARGMLLQVAGGFGGTVIADFLGLGGGCDCVSEEEFNQFKSEVTEWKNATRQQLDNLTQWAKDNTEAIRLLNVQAEKTENFTRYLAAQAADTLKALQIQSAASLKFESQVHYAFMNMSDRVAAAEDANVATLNLLSTSLIAVDAQIKTAFYALSNTTTNNTRATRQMITDLTRQMTYINNFLHTLTKADKAIIGAIAEMNLDSKRQIILTNGVLQAIADTTTEGQYFPFLNEYPTPPTDDPDAYKEMLVANQRFLYTSDLVGGGTRVIELDVELYCSTLKVFGLPRDYVTFRDFLDMMGPADCEETDTCSCFVIYSKYQCTLNPSGSGFSYARSVTTITNTTQSVPNLCQASPAVVTLVDTAIVTNISEFERILTTRCSEQQPNTEVVVWSVNTGGQMIGNNIGVTSCTFDFAFTSAFNASTPERIFVNNIQIGFSFTLREVASTFRAIIGGVPQGLTYTYDPFAIRDGQEANCLTASWMSYTSTLLPVYKLSDPIEQTSITVTIDGVSTTLTDVLASSRDQFTILSELTVVGEPDSPSFVYDIPQRDLSDSPFPISRTALYALFPNYTCVSKTCWERYYGVTFNQLEGMFVVSPYKRAYDPFLTVCTDPRRVYDGSQCVIRDRNRIDCPTNSSCIFTKKNARYLVSGIDVPGVEITTLVLSDCPLVAVDRRPAATVATLTNQQEFPVTVKVVIEGPCPSVQNSVGIPASGSTTITVPLCNAVPATRPLPSEYWSNLTVYRLMGLEYRVCNNSVRLNVTGDRAQVLEAQGLVDIGLSRSQTYLIQDPVMVALVDQLTQTQVQLQTLKTYVAPLYDALQLSNVPTYNNLLDSIITGSTTLLNATITQVNSSRTATLTAIANISSYSEVAAPMAAILANASTAMKNAEQAYLDLKNATIASWNAYYTLANQTVQLVLSNEILKNATAAFANGVISLAGTLRDNGNFGFLGDIADGITWALGKAGEGIVTAAEWVADKVVMMAEAIADFAKGILEDMTSLFNILTKIIPYIIGGLLAIFVIYRLWAHSKANSDLSKGGVRSASGDKVYEFETLNKNMNVIGMAVQKLAKVLENSPDFERERDKITSAHEALIALKLPYQGVERKPPSVTERMGLNFGGFFKSSPPTPTPAPAPTQTETSSVVAAVFNAHEHEYALELESLLADES